MLEDVTDSNNGWYTASYVLQKAGPFAIAIGLADAWAPSTFAGVCHHTVTAAKQCTIMEAQNVVVAGQQAKLRIARFDRCGRHEVVMPCARLQQCYKGRSAVKACGRLHEYSSVRRFGNKVTTAEGQPGFCVDVEGPGAAATEVVESGNGEVIRIFNRMPFAGATSNDSYWAATDA